MTEKCKLLAEMIRDAGGKAVFFGGAGVSTKGAIEAVANSRLLIIGGTSLAVYPAASLIHYAGGKVCIINLSETSSDRYTSLAIHAPIGVVFDEVLKILNL